MKYILYVVLLICSFSCTSQDQEVSADSEPTDVSLTDSIQENFDSEIEPEELFALAEKYNNTGDTKYLQGILDYWKNGLNQEYTTTFSPLYYGIVSELMGDNSTALKYYKQSEQFAQERITKPLDDIEFEFGVTSEIELIEMFELTDTEFDITKYKSGKIILQKHWLYLSQIALGQDKFQELDKLKLTELGIANIFMDYEIKKREDIFKLILGWDN